MAAKTAVMQRIVQEQSAVVKLVISGFRPKFAVETAQEVVRRGSQNFKTAIRDYAIANQLKLVRADFGMRHDVQNELQEVLSVKAFEAGLTGNTEPEIAQQAETLVRQALPWFDFEDDSPISSVFLGYALDNALKLAIKKAIQGAMQHTALPTDVVGISGNTYPWKETIKSIAGDGGYLFDKVARVWNVRRSTWDYLQQHYPSVAGTELIPCEATQVL